MGKVWIIVAVSLIAAGALTFMVALIAANFDFALIFNGKYETNTYTPDESFDKIVIKTNTAKIKLVPAPDGICKVVCYEQPKVKHSVAVKEGMLTIDVVDSRRWYEYISFFSFESPAITVYLPETEYSSLNIDTATGDIEIPGTFNFGNVSIKASTADVSCKASISQMIKITTDTGDIKVENASVGEIALSVSTGDIDLENVNCSGNAWVYVTTGDAEISNLSCKNFTSDGSTGELTLADVVVSDKLSVIRSTGDVALVNSDAGEIVIKVSTGDVKGSLRSPKIFTVNTSTGKKSVPYSTTGGICKITTSTGDVSIVVK